MRLAVVGTGYVGLVTGACFAEMGNHVVCVDKDQAKLKQLRQGHVAIHEPDLEEMVHRQLASERLSFTDDLAGAIADCAIVFIAVGTPPTDDGSADLSAVVSVAAQVGQLLNDYKLVVCKSTVPVGTADIVSHTILTAIKDRQADIDFDVVSNPEFLKEGDAVHDFMRPDRIIIGTESDRAEQIMRELYRPFARHHDKVQVMSRRDAEMTKYAANAMLATKISFINEIANICERVGADVEMVRQGIGADERIGYSFIYPGCGYGGSCFPKDVQALIHTAESHGFDPALLKSVEARNQAQKQVLFEKINRHFNGALSDKTIAVWGLAFKPGTDDMRQAPSIDLIHALVNAGATVRAFDPIAMDAAKLVFPEAWVKQGKLSFIEDQYEVLRGADAMALVTEWKQFRQPDFDRMGKLMKALVIFDGRNQYDSLKHGLSTATMISIGRTS